LTALLEWLYSITQIFNVESYGLAIILLTVLVKLAIFPLTYKQMKSMRNLAKLQPVVQELQKKYKNNTQKLNQELVKLYQKHNVNPMSGCLPLLIQLPIFIALYRALITFEYPSEAAALFLGYNLSEAYGFTSHPYYLILPILAGLTTYLQSKLSSPNATTDPTQRTLLIVMPIFIAYITASVPAGLGLYWVTMNVMTILQQLIINKKIEREQAEASA